jgi:hypothetical protein
MIRRAIERTIGNLDLRQQMIAAGKLRASLFRWDDVGRKVSSVLGVPCSSEAATATSPSMSLNGSA